MKPLFISGAFVPPQQGGTIDVVDPSTGEVFGTIGRASGADDDRAVAAGRTALDALRVSWA